MSASQPPEHPGAIQLRGLSKSFGLVDAVREIDLDVRDGEFFSMLGPSGSGKTTVLRMIAGFELPTRGSILLDGKDVSRLPPFDRDVNTVFQDYALFPHLTVLENVEYGLRVKRVPKRERRGLAQEALHTVRLADYGERRPGQLSGGQRQRVALARALVLRPKVLLLDEPLGALDLKLRQDMQIELKQLQREVGITFVFVTHDQEEALTMSDRVAVFHQGRIEQVGTPMEIYERPATAFVAGFVGTSNLLSGPAAEQVVGASGVYSIRPERIQVRLEGDPPPGDAAENIGVSGTVTGVVFAGPSIRLSVSLDHGGSLTVLQPNRGEATEVLHYDAARVRLSWHAKDLLRVAPRSS